MYFRASKHLSNRDVSVIKITGYYRKQKFFPDTFGKALMLSSILQMELIQNLDLMGMGKHYLKKQHEK